LFKPAIQTVKQVNCEGLVLREEKPFLKKGLSLPLISLLFPKTLIIKRVSFGYPF